MELFILIILLSLTSIFLSYNLYRYKKDRVEYFESLGAKIIKYG